MENIIHMHIKYPNNMLKVSDESEKTKYVHKVNRQGLTTKRAVELLLEGTLRFNVCRFCLNISPNLSELDQILQISTKGILYKVSVRDMVATFHPFKITDNPNLPNKVCNKCLDKTLSSYLFSQQCEQSDRALRNCLDDVFEKLEKLDPLERTKKRGRQKLIPNLNKIYVTHKEVIDYAEPIIHMVNRNSGNVTVEPEEINRLECLKCCEILPSLESLLNHKKIHPKHMWFNCRYCGKSFPRRSQIINHIKNNHIKGNELPLLNQNSPFKCLECGNFSEDYVKHLQHLEKHKFQTVVDHLINRKMDKLCSICLNKEAILNDLNRTFCFHGGYPELDGERTYYNILSTTLPEKIHKYEELLVPTNATIVSISKKIKNTIFNILSNPMILSKSNVDFDEVFIFSEPFHVEKYMYIKINTTRSATIKPVQHLIQSNMVTEDIIDIRNNSHKNLCMLNACNKTNRKNKLGKNGNNSDHVNTTKVLNRCKVCWIFNKPVCEICLNNDKTSILNNIAVVKENSEENIKNIIAANVINNDNAIDRKLNLSHSCKFCWIFKIPGYCNLCNKTLVAENSVNKKNTFVVPKLNIKRKLENYIKKNNKINKRQCQMHYLNKTGTKICETCITQALTAYIFIHRTRFIRQRLKTCVASMLDSLNDVTEIKHNLFIEISQKLILEVEQSNDANISIDGEDFDEGKLKIDFLEDEFRTQLKSEDTESEVSSQSSFDYSLRTDSTNKTDELFMITENPAKRATRTYMNKKLNGLQENKEKHINNICKEFLTFKNKKPINKRDKHTCPLCSKHFITQYHLKKHVLKHITKEVQCSQCKVTFKSKFLLYEHTKMVHLLNKTSYSSCKTCGRAFEDENKMKLHLRSHISKRCMLCEKLFLTQHHYNSHMQRHMLIKTKNGSRPTCSFCEKACADENKLTLHVNKAHLQIKPYNCDMCDKQFYVESNLRRHKVVHTISSKEKCVICDKILKCRRNLVVHIRKHLRTKPIQCLICGESFYSEGKVKAHMKSFHGGYLFCKLCRNIYNSKSDLKKHVLIVHSVF